MEIDWEETLSEAHDSPRGIISEALARADDIKDLIIIHRDQDGSCHLWCTVDDIIVMLGLLENAKMAAFDNSEND